MATVYRITITQKSKESFTGLMTRSQPEIVNGLVALAMDNGKWRYFCQDSIDNRDSVLESHTSGASDLFTTRGVIVGLQNDSGATITLTSVSVRIYRQVNAE